MFPFGLTLRMRGDSRGRWELKSWESWRGNGLYMDPYRERLLGISLRSRFSGDPAIFGRTFFFLVAFNAGVTAGYSPAPALGPGWRRPEDFLPIPPDPPSPPPSSFSPASLVSPPPLVKREIFLRPAPATLLRLGAAFVAPGLLSVAQLSYQDNDAKENKPR